MKWLLLLLLSIVFMLPLSVQASISLDQALTQCRAEENALKRLVCYDDIAMSKQQSLPVQANKGQQQAAVSRAKPDSKPAAVPSVVTESDKVPATSEHFGLENRRQSNPTSELNLTVANLSHNNRKELIIEFDNGQVWRQQGTRYYPIAVGEQHQIKRGVLGSFSLGNERNNRSARVIRER